ncbi:hypothetical protein GQ55_1G298900 [Panicum hallii var. hallii]|uniref:Uncharacterized protein n=1 Tax=Panicum hallii var. hallii TaxID=1504633 RepID=A0A2T7F8Y6_9POAL|nr:hypothetical protein GQ55_1G298900 [Panicum hallii var. hallii]
MRCTRPVRVMTGRRQAGSHIPHATYVTSRPAYKTAHGSPAARCSRRRRASISLGGSDQRSVADGDGAWAPGCSLFPCPCYDPAPPRKSDAAAAKDLHGVIRRARGEKVGAQSRRCMHG